MKTGRMFFADDGPLSKVVTLSEVLARQKWPTSVIDQEEGKVPGSMSVLHSMVEFG